MSELLTVERDRVGRAGTPVFVIRSPDQKPRPLVLCCHGFGGQKEHLLPYGVELGRCGYVAVLIDAVNHGERRPKDFEDRASSQFLPLFVECIGGTADEIPGLLDALQARSDVLGGPVGMAGFSMGGYITFRACSVESRIAVAAPCGASGDWRMDERAPFTPATAFLKAALSTVNPAARVNDFPPRALLIQNGTLDEVVPVEQSRRFVELARPAYAACPEKLKWIEYPELGHTFSPEMQEEVTSWLRRWLPSPPVQA